MGHESASRAVRGTRHYHKNPGTSPSRARSLLHVQLAGGEGARPLQPRHQGVSTDAANSFSWFLDAANWLTIYHIIIFGVNKLFPAARGSPFRVK